MRDVSIKYKKDIPEKQNRFKAEIVSFLNSEGGEIHLGVSDDGNIDRELIKNKKKEWEQKISNWIVNAFVPDVTHLIYIEPNEEPFKIKILKGKNKPYFYKDGEGFNAKGVYVRIGSTKRVASFEEIQRMIRQHDSCDFETLPIEIKDLTFKYLETDFLEKGIKFDKIGLSLKNKDGKYNKAALLLSDQNPIKSKMAVYQGTNNKVFLDKKEFTGSLLKQINNAMYYADLLNKKKVTFNDPLYRTEHRDIPILALREAIANAYCHRDYTLTGDILIQLYDDRAEIYSPGSLPDGLTLEDIKKGMVAKRNKIIVNVFDKLNIIENYASGVRKIFDEYVGFEKQPEYQISDSGVIVTLYNRNYSREEDSIKINTIIDKSKENERHEKIISLVKVNPRITAEGLKEYLGVSLSTVRRDLSTLKTINKLKYEGGAKEGYWIVL